MFPRWVGCCCRESGIRVSALSCFLARRCLLVSRRRILAMSVSTLLLTALDCEGTHLGDSSFQWHLKNVIWITRCLGVGMQIAVIINEKGRNKQHQRISQVGYKYTQCLFGQLVFKEIAIWYIALIIFPALLLKSFKTSQCEFDFCSKSNFAHDKVVSQFEHARKVRRLLFKSKNKINTNHLFLFKEPNPT